MCRASVHQISDPHIIVGIGVVLARWFSAPVDTPFLMVLHHSSPAELLVLAAAAAPCVLKVSWCLTQATRALSFSFVAMGRSYMVVPSLSFPAGFVFLWVMMCMSSLFLGMKLLLR